MADVGLRRDFFRALRQQTRLPLILESITPELARSTSPSGTSLLHEACELGAPPCLIKEIARLYPEAASRSYYPNDNEEEYSLLEGIGDMPVFLACSQDIPCIKTVEILIDAYPGCLRASKLHIPLFHYCCRLRSSKEVKMLQKLVYERSSHAGISILKTRDLTGFYPIHHLAQGRNIELMKEWIDKSPQLFFDDQYPKNHLLHYAMDDALHTGHNPEMVDYLTHLMPKAVATPNLKGELPIHLALWSKDREILLRHYPFTILHTARDGRTPIGRIRAMVESRYQEIRAEAQVEPEEHQGWEEYARWINEDFQREIYRLLVFIRNQALPPLQDAVSEIMQYHHGPTDLVDNILQYAVPHHNEVKCLRLSY